MNTIDKLNLRLSPLLASCDDATIHENKPLVTTVLGDITWNEQIANTLNDQFSVGTKFPTIAVNYPWEG